jgi:MoaA/NifB/PqqE/SkfB family radical SAM enzyme
MFDLKNYKESNTFCSIPFVHQEKQFNNRHNICCYNNCLQSDNENQNSTESFNSQKMFQIRHAMLAGEKPKECSFCYNQEALGLVSPRKRETNGWMASGSFALALQENLNKFLDNQTIIPLSYDLRYSNTCTLKCRMCNPFSSSSINAENKKISNKWQDRFPYVENPRINHEVNLDKNIKKIYLAGGEPLIEPYNLILLKQLAEINPKVQLLINTSLNHLSAEFREVLDKFEDLLFVVSIDGVGKLNDYIRNGSNWDTVISNLERIKNHNVMFSTTTSMYNVLDIAELVEYLKINYPNYCHCIFLVNNEEELFVENLPLELRNDLITKLENTLKDAPRCTLDGLNNLITTLKINNYDPQRFTKFIKYTKILDETRGESIMDIQPKFKDYFTE